jgi:hypothetical protein
MIRIFVSPNLYAKTLNLKVMVLADQALGQWLGYESGAVMNKIGQYKLSAFSVM